MMWLTQQMTMWLALAFALGFVTSLAVTVRRVTVQRWVEVPPEPVAAPVAAEDADGESTVVAEDPAETAEPPSPFPTLEGASEPAPWEQEELWSRPASRTATASTEGTVRARSTKEPADEWDEAATNWRTWADEAAGRARAEQHSSEGPLEDSDEEWAATDDVWGAGGERDSARPSDDELFARDRAAGAPSESLPSDEELFAGDRTAPVEEPPAATSVGRDDRPAPWEPAPFPSGDDSPFPSPSDPWASDAEETERADGPTGTADVFPTPALAAVDDVSTDDTAEVPEGEGASQVEQASAEAAGEVLDDPARPDSDAAWREDQHGPDPEAGTPADEVDPGIEESANELAPPSPTYDEPARPMSDTDASSRPDEAGPGESAGQAGAAQPFRRKRRSELLRERTESEYDRQPPTASAPAWTPPAEVPHTPANPAEVRGEAHESAAAGVVMDRPADGVSAAPWADGPAEHRTLDDLESGVDDFVVEQIHSLEAVPEPAMRATALDEDSGVAEAVPAWGVEQASADAGHDEPPAEPEWARSEAPVEHEPVSIEDEASPVHVHHDSPPFLDSAGTETASEAADVVETMSEVEPGASVETPVHKVVEEPGADVAQVSRTAEPELTREARAERLAALPVDEPLADAQWAAEAGADAEDAMTERASSSIEQVAEHVGEVDQVVESLVEEESFSSPERVEEPVAELEPSSVPQEAQGSIADAEQLAEPGEQAQHEARPDGPAEVPDTGSVVELRPETDPPDGVGDDRAEAPGVVDDEPAGAAPTIEGHDRDGGVPHLEEPWSPYEEPEHDEPVASEDVTPQLDGHDGHDGRGRGWARSFRRMRRSDMGEDRKRGGRHAHAAPTAPSTTTAAAERRADQPPRLADTATSLAVEEEPTEDMRHGVASDDGAALEAVAEPVSGELESLGWVEPQADEGSVTSTDDEVLVPDDEAASDAVVEAEGAQVEAADSEALGWADPPAEDGSEQSSQSEVLEPDVDAAWGSDGETPPSGNVAESRGADAPAADVDVQPLGGADANLDEAADDLAEFDLSNGVPRPHGPGSAYAPADGTIPLGYAIKGQNSTMLFYPRTARFYTRVVADVYFDTEESAERAGFVRFDRRSSTAHVSLRPENLR